MPIRVKICGICSLQEAAIVVEEGADALGLVFAESPRRVSPREAALIANGIPPFVSRTGVFVNEKINNVLEIASLCGLDTLQFHGEESPDYCSRFPGFRVIKSFAVSSSLTYDMIQRYPVDAVLLDTKYTDKKGGGGETFDWRLALPFSGGSLPLILAGGLNPKNISEALQMVRPYAIDVSSGLEKDGRKDREKIRVFMREVRRFTGIESKSPPHLSPLPPGERRICMPQK